MTPRTPPTASGATDRADFIAAADAICTETAEQINADTLKLFPEGAAANEKQLGRLFAEVTIPALDEQYEEIAALPVPEGDEDEVEAIIDAADQAIAESEEDPASLLVLQGAETPFSDVNQLSADYGLVVCGSAESG